VAVRALGAAFALTTHKETADLSAVPLQEGNMGQEGGGGRRRQRLRAFEALEGPSGKRSS
jgi:hypothetical protein